LVDASDHAHVARPRTPTTSRSFVHVQVAVAVHVADHDHVNDHVS
jgi:hypothetical protein